MSAKWAATFARLYGVAVRMIFQRSHPTDSGTAMTSAELLIRVDDNNSNTMRLLLVYDEATDPVCEEVDEVGGMQDESIGPAMTRKLLTP